MKINRAKLTLLIFAVLCVASFAFFVAAQENAASNKNIFQDSDQDGLSDDEEKTYGTDPNNRDTDGDGYTDGAEVKSGYDPLKPAPGDKIVQSSKFKVQSSNENTNEENLTQELSAKVAYLITERSAENKDITIEDLDAMIETAAGKELAFEDLPEIDEKEIKIKKQNYQSLSEEKRKEKEKEDALEYLTVVSYIIVNNSPKKITSLDDIDKLSEEIISRVGVFSNNLSDISYFEDLAKKGEVILEEMKDVDVPENLAPFHIKGLQLAKYAISLKNQARPDFQDPIRAIADLSKVQSLISLSLEFSKNFSEEINKLGVEEIPLKLDS